MGQAAQILLLLPSCTRWHLTSQTGRDERPGKPARKGFSVDKDPLGNSSSRGSTGPGGMRDDDVRERHVHGARAGQHCCCHHACGRKGAGARARGPGLQRDAGAHLRGEPRLQPGQHRRPGRAGGYGPDACYGYQTLGQVDAFGPSVTTWAQWCARQLDNGIPAASPLPALAAGCEKAVAYARAHPQGGMN